MLRNLCRRVFRRMLDVYFHVIIFGTIMGAYQIATHNIVPEATLQYSIIAGLAFSLFRFRGEQQEPAA